MKDRTPKDGRPPAPYAPPEGREAPGELRGLFERGADLARREAGRSEAEPPKGVGRRLLDVARVLTIVAAVATGVYGVANFKDAPIRQTATGWVGKTGAQYPREHYERFKTWERAMFVTFPLAILVNFAAAAAGARRGADRNRG